MYPTTPGTVDNQGSTETYIGNWMKDRGARDKLIVATKVVGNGFARLRDGGKINRTSLTIALDDSLRRLQTDYIDLYQLHWPNRGSYAFRQHWGFDPSKQDKAETQSDHAEIIDVMTEFAKAGKVRHFGLSNESAWGLGHFLKLTESRKGLRPVSIQNEYNLLSRLFDLDLAEMCHHEDVGLLPYSPLAAGLLTGKYTKGAIPDGSRRSINDVLGGRYSEQSAHVADLYVEIARKHGLDPAQMALAFTLNNPQVAATIIGATNMAQLTTNIGSSDITLSEEVLTDIATVRRAHPMPI